MEMQDGKRGPRTRRRTERVQLAIPVTLTGSAVDAVSSTLNVGGGGALVRTVPGLSPGAELDIRVVGEEGALEVRARVLRRQGQCWALEFLELDVEGCRRLHELVAGRQRELELSRAA